MAGTITTGDWIAIASAVVAVLVALALYALSRRDRRRDLRNDDQRDAARKLRTALRDAQASISRALVEDEGSGYAAWLARFQAALPVRTDLAPETRRRLESLEELFERLPHVDASRFVQAFTFAFVDSTDAAQANIDGRRPPPRLTPKTEDIRRLIADGQRLGTGARELDAAIARRRAHVERQREQRLVRLGITVGACSMLLVGSLASLIVGR